MLVVSCGEPAPTSPDAPAVPGLSSIEGLIPTEPAVPWLAADLPPGQRRCLDWALAETPDGYPYCDPWPNAGRVSCEALSTAQRPGEDDCTRVGSACGAIELPDGAPGERWFVSSGAIRGDGTEAAPLGSLGEALEAASPGDLVELAEGDYPLEDLWSTGGVTVVGPCVERARLLLSGDGLSVADDTTMIDVTVEVAGPLVTRDQLVLRGAVLRTRAPGSEPVLAVRDDGNASLSDVRVDGRIEVDEASLILNRVAVRTSGVGPALQSRTGRIELSSSVVDAGGADGVAATRARPDDGADVTLVDSVLFGRIAVAGRARLGAMNVVLRAAAPAIAVAGGEVAMEGGWIRVAGAPAVMAGPGSGPARATVRLEAAVVTHERAGPASVSSLDALGGGEISLSNATVDAAGRTCFRGRPESPAPDAPVVDPKLDVINSALRDCGRFLTLATGIATVSSSQVVSRGVLDASVSDGASLTVGFASWEEGGTLQLVGEGSTLSVMSTIIDGGGTANPLVRSNRGTVLVVSSRIRRAGLFLEALQTASLSLGGLVLESVDRLLDADAEGIVTLSGISFGASGRSSDPLVSIRGGSLNATDLTMRRGGGFFELRGVDGMLADVRVEDQSTGRSAIHASGGSTLSLERVAVVGARGVGLAAQGPGTAVSLVDVSIDDTRTAIGEALSRVWGHGVHVVQGAVLEGERLQVSGGSGTGVLVADLRSELSVASLVIDGIRAEPCEGACAGRGPAEGLASLRGAFVRAREFAIKEIEGAAAFARRGAVLLLTDGDVTDAGELFSTGPDSVVSLEGVRAAGNRGADQDRVPPDPAVF